MVLETLGFLVELFLWFLGLVMRGIISPEVAALVLVVLIALRAIGWAIRWAFRLLGVAALLTTLASYSGGDIGPALGGFLVLLFMLFGFWIMLRPLRR